MTHNTYLPTRTNRIPGALLLVALAFSTNLAAAPAPRASFESALITGAGNHISVARVPLIDSTGTKVIYKDVTIDFEMDNTGKLTLVPFSPTVNPSPSLITSGFMAGIYKDGKGAKYQLTSPSVIPDTNRAVWSLVITGGTTQFSMSWITGPVSGHPNLSSLEIRKITNTAFSWGIIGANANAPTGWPFLNLINGTVVGAVQSGNQLALYQFEYDTGAGGNQVDRSTSPTLCTTTAC